jgi:hypothetical protein
MAPVDDHMEAHGARKQMAGTHRHQPGFAARRDTERELHGVAEAKGGAPNLAGPCQAIFDYLDAELRRLLAVPADEKNKTEGAMDQAMVAKNLADEVQATMAAIVKMLDTVASESISARQGAAINSRVDRAAVGADTDAMTNRPVTPIGGLYEAKTDRAPPRRPCDFDPVLAAGMAELREKTQDLNACFARFEAYANNRTSMFFGI